MERRGRRWEGRNRDRERRDRDRGRRHRERDREMGGITRWYVKAKNILLFISVSHHTCKSNDRISLFSSMPPFFQSFPLLMRLYN